MPYYERRLGPNGTILMVAVTPPTEQPVTAPLVQPPAATLKRRKKLLCVACDPPRPFAGEGVLSMHFAKSHKDLKTEKDSWRQYVKDDSGADAE